MAADGSIGASMDVAELRAELSVAREQLERLQRQNEELRGAAAAEQVSRERAVQDERDRIARVIHDGVAQNLAFLMLKMEVISRLLDRNPRRVKGEFTNVLAVLESSLQELRKSVSALRSSTSLPDSEKSGTPSSSTLPETSP